MLGVREIADALAHTMMVRHYQAVGRHQAGGAAQGQPDAAEPWVLEPCGAGRPAVFRAHLGCGEIVEGPHSLVGEGRGSDARGGDQQQYTNQDRHPNSFLKILLSLSPSAIAGNRPAACYRTLCAVSNQSLGGEVALSSLRLWRFGSAQKRRLRQPQPPRVLRAAEQGLK